MRHPRYTVPKAVRLLLLLVLGLYGLSACGTNPGSSAPGVLHITDKLRASGTAVSGKPQTSFVPAGGHYESLVAGNDVTYIGSDNGNLYALQADSGNLLWHYDAGNPIYVVSLVNGSIYATSGANDDVMYALDATRGTVRWRRQIDAGIFGAVVVDGVVYLNTNDSGKGSRGALVYALRASDGAVLWRDATNAGMPEPLTVLDGIVYTRATEQSGSSVSDSIYTLRASDGHFLWKYPVAERPDGQPVEVNGIVYFVTGYDNVYALQAQTGALLWHFSGYSGIFAAVSPVVVAGVVYVGTDMGIVYALQAGDGKLLWHDTLPASFDNTLAYDGPPVIVDNVLYVAVNSGTVFALRAQDGSLLWRRTTGRSAFGPLIVTDGTVQVATQGNTVYALRASDGAMLWQHASGYFATWQEQNPPRVLANGMLTIGTEDGVVTARRASDGTQLWRFTIKQKAVLTEPVRDASVQFGAIVSYEQALRSVTDLGMLVSAPCAMGGTKWRPIGDASTFKAYPDLWVVATSLAPAGWLARLKSLPGVQSVQEGGNVFSCPALFVAPPGVMAFLPEKQAGSYVRVTFGSSAQSYEATLAAVSSLGFRLGNPCYEQVKGAKPAWSPMGQEALFANAHALILVTTGLNSTHWQEQLRAVVGVTGEETAFDVKC